MSGPSVIVLGLDGATLDLIDPWVDAGALPNLEALMKSGRTGYLRSTLPYVTPLAWPSIYTGVGPGKHGSLGFRKRLPGTYQWVLNSSNDVMRPAVWELLAEAGLRTCDLFVPFSFPAKPTNGVAVTGAFGPRRFEPRTVHPESLLHDLRERFDESKLFALRQQPGVPLGGVVNRIIEGVEEQSRLMAYVFKRETFDFSFVVWHDTDRAAHLLWHHSELPCPDVSSPMFRVYEAVDRGIGELMSASSGDPLFIVCSDHGTYPVSLRVNSHLWLEQQGFLRLKRSAGVQAVSNSRALWRRVPQPLKKVVSNKARQKIQQKVSSGIVKQNALIDWDRSAAYPQPISAEAFFLNKVGREPQGTVAPEEAEARLTQIEGALMKAESPEGEQLIGSVHRGADLYQGPYVERGPDLVADPIKGVMFVPTGVGDTELFSVPERPDMEHGLPGSLGYHQRNGMYSFSGPGVIPGRGEIANVCDITPTILRYLDVPLPRDLDGQALTAAFDELGDPGWAEDRPDDLGPPRVPLAPEDEAEISRHLQDLGYIE